MPGLPRGHGRGKPRHDRDPGSAPGRGPGAEQQL